MEKTTWKDLIEYAAQGEPVVACTLSEEEMDREFDRGYGLPQGTPFTAWTKTRVLFPVCYDGAEWVGSAPRNPSDEVTEHQGSW